MKSTKYDGRNSFPTRFDEDGTYELGDFWPDGSWNHQGTRPEDQNPLRHLYWFIDSLCTKRRRSPETYPARFAEHILGSRFKTAFPNAASGQWHRATNWLQAQGLTSAEQTVLRAGHGFSPDGHSPTTPCYFPPEQIPRPYEIPTLLTSLFNSLSMPPLNPRMPPQTSSPPTPTPPSSPPPFAQPGASSE